MIGHFHVMAPSRARYLDLIVRSDKTPEGVEESAVESIFGEAFSAIARAAKYVLAAWGVETFPSEGTSAENEMSVVQYALLSGQRILLTGDAGREALQEAIDYAPYVGLALPGLDRVQVPHHGSRRNVSTEILDQLLGPRLARHPPPGHETFTAEISSAKADRDHPRRTVVRAFMHRGARVITTEEGDVCTHQNAPPRSGWGAVAAAAYPVDEQE